MKSGQRFWRLVVFDESIEVVDLLTGVAYVPGGLMVCWVSGGDESELELRREVRPYVMVDARVSDNSVDWFRVCG